MYILCAITNVWKLCRHYLPATAKISDSDNHVVVLHKDHPESAENWLKRNVETAVTVKYARIVTIQFGALKTTLCYKSH